MSVFGSTIPSLRTTVIVLLGKAGSGKTDTIRRLVEAGLKVAAIDVDGGMQTVADLEGSPSFLYTRADTIAAFSTALTDAKALPPDWIIFIDGGSRLVENKAAEIQGERQNMSLPEHGQVGDFSRRFFLFLNRRGLGHHTILTTLEDILQDEEGRMFYGPLFPGKKSASVFPDKFDAILRCKVEAGADGPVFRIALKATEKEAVKLRVAASVYESLPLSIPAAEFGTFYRDVILRGNHAATTAATEPQKESQP